MGMNPRRACASAKSDVNREARKNAASTKNLHYGSGSAAAFRAAQIDWRAREDAHYISGSVAVALLRPLVEIRRRAAAAGDVRIRVDELDGRELVDRGRLRLGLNNLRVLLRRPLQAVIRREARRIARHVNLHETPVGRENQHPLRRLPEWKRNLPVRRPHLRDDEVPSADEPVLEVLRSSGRCCRPPVAPLHSTLAPSSRHVSGDGTGV